MQEKRYKLLMNKVFFQQIEKEIYFDLTSLNTDVWRYLKLHNDENFTNKYNITPPFFGQLIKV